jgi:hypothetical protein
MSSNSHPSISFTRVLQTMATLSSPVLLAFLLFALFLVVRRVVPLISNLFSSNVKLRTISPRSIRGLEWSRITSISGKPVKLLVRVERYVALQLSRLRL